MMSTMAASHRLHDLVQSERTDVQVYTGTLCRDVEYITVEAEKNTPAVEVVSIAAVHLKLQNPESLELAEVFYSAGHVCKERRMDASENPLKIQYLWPKICLQENDNGLVTEHRFYLRKKEAESNRMYSWSDNRTDQRDDIFSTLRRQISSTKEYPDLCNLPDLNEKTLLDNLRRRFENGDIYTYIGSILIAVNPFKFYPIYNPKYVKLYQNRHYTELPPHIFAIADAAFFNMMQSKRNQCIVISGESGSGKTESTNLLLHHLTALSQRGIHASGVEQTILGGGPVLEAFGNAVTVHNINSSRFGKFIQINYKNNGAVHGAVVEKYLLEKSRIVSQIRDERNYHVFYYLLNGASGDLKSRLSLTRVEDYTYLRHGAIQLEEECASDEQHEFSRLQQSMDLVGFSPSIQNKLFSLLAAVLHIGNIEFKRKEYRHDESVSVKNEEVLSIISRLLQVNEQTLIDALTQKKTTAGDETVVISYKMEDALAARDAMAKCLYGALFDWIVFKVNHALLAKRHTGEHEGNHIGILDIFGFEDFYLNSFEQFCINFANERLQYYFNQHVFKLEQEEYRREGIDWKNVDFIDNTGCLELFTKKTTGLFSLLDEECNLPGVSNERLLSKFNECQKSNSYYSVPQMREMAFIVEHYAGNIKYQIDAFREKNTDLVRPDIVGVFKNSSLTFVRELVAIDPVAMMRWGTVRALFRSIFAFKQAGQKRRSDREQENLIESYVSKCSLRTKSDTLGINREPLGEIGNRRSPGRELLDRLDNTDHSDFNERLMRRATKLLEKRSTLKEKPRTGYRDMQVLKTLASRQRSSDGKKFSKKTPATVAAQFQISLNKLMDTLNKANPFFVRCIKSNYQRVACHFDEELVMRQLRYTGMLATVKIRQCGYNYRFTFQEFIQMYSLLLLDGIHSSETDVRKFLSDMSFQNYQIGITKVFLREVEKTMLDNMLHRALMSRIVKLQRWMKTIVQRRMFLRLQNSAFVIQVSVRRFIAMKLLDDLRTEQQACIDIQRHWRGFVVRRAYLDTLSSILYIQCAVRGWAMRKRYAVMVKDQKLHEKVMARRSLVNIEIAAKRHRIEAAWDAGRPVTYFISGPTSEGDSDLQRSPGASLDSLSSAAYDSSSLGNLSTESSSSLQDQSRKFLTPPEGRERQQIKRSDHILVRRNKVQKIVAPPISPIAKDDSSIDYDSTRSPNDVSHIDVPRSTEVASSTDPTRNISQLSPEFIRQIEENLQKRQDKQPRKFHIGQRLANMITGGSKRVKKENDGDTGSDPASYSDNSYPSMNKSPEFIRKPLDPLPIDGQKTQLTRRKKLSRKISTKGSLESPPTPVPRETSTGSGNWSVAGMSQWQYPADVVITSLAALRHLDEFISKKIKEFSKHKGKRDTVFDVVFKKALSAFHMDLKGRSSTAQQEADFGIKYHELMTKFESVLLAYAKSELINASFPVTMGINAFRGFLDEFIKENKKLLDKWDDKKNNPKNRKRDKQKKESFEYNGHRYDHVQFNIQTFCELCASHIWIMEKAVVCRACKFAAHRKCYTKATQPCSASKPAFVFREKGSSSNLFGVPLASLLSPDDHIPPFIDHLITAIELHGLYTVGVYRKSGAAAKVKAIRAALEEDASSVNLSDYPVHALTSLLKNFLRELPEPLLTFELYDDFMHSMDAEDKEQLQAIYRVIGDLPSPNHALFERLIFHLARIALNEDSNKMSANGLAIVFAPCLLLSIDNQTAQEFLNQVPKQTACVEAIISEQLRKLRVTLADICTLDSAQDAAHKRLSKVRQIVRLSHRVNKMQKVSSASTVDRVSSDVSDHDDLDMGGTVPDDIDMDSVFEEERELQERIKRIEAEREELTNSLPLLEHDTGGSDDDMIGAEESFSLVDMLDSQCDVDGNEDLAVSFDLPVMTRELRHLTKRRASTAPKRPPTRYQTVLKDKPKVRKISSRSRRRRRNRPSSSLKEIMV